MTYDGKELEDDRTLSSYNLNANTTLSMASRRVIKVLPTYVRVNNIKPYPVQIFHWEIVVCELRDGDG